MSLMPSSKTTADTPDRPKRSRSRRWSADGPPGTAEEEDNVSGVRIRFPPMPALTTDTRFPYAAWSRRDNTSGHRSSPFKRRQRAVGDRIAERADDDRAGGRHHVDGVEEIPRCRRERERRSSSLAGCAPDCWRLRYEVCSAFACQVIGPLGPMTWNETASLRPSVMAPGGSFNSTASLYPAARRNVDARAARRMSPAGSCL